MCSAFQPLHYHSSKKKEERKEGRGVDRAREQAWPLALLLSPNPWLGHSRPHTLGIWHFAQEVCPPVVTSRLRLTGPWSDSQKSPLIPTSNAEQFTNHRGSLHLMPPTQGPLTALHQISLLRPLTEGFPGQTPAPGFLPQVLKLLTLVSLDCQPHFLAFSFLLTRAWNDLPPLPPPITLMSQ